MSFNPIITYQQQYEKKNEEVLTKIEFQEKVQHVRTIIHNDPQLLRIENVSNDPMPRIHASKFNIEDAIFKLQKYGCLIVENIIPLETCDHFVRDMQPYLDAIRTGSDDFTGRATKRAGALVARTPNSWLMAAHPIVYEICQAILGLQVIHAGKNAVQKKNGEHIFAKNVDENFGNPWQLHVTQIIAINKTETPQMMHRDKWASMYDFPDIETNIGSMWAVGSDFTAENGATRVILGSHKWPKQRVPDEKIDTVQQATMKRGSALFFLGSCWHGGGGNVSNETRYGVTYQWNLAWLRQEENQYLSTLPEIAKHFPRSLTKLIGYDVANASLGYYGNIRHPSKVFNSKRAINWASSSSKSKL